MRPATPCVSILLSLHSAVLAIGFVLLNDEPKLRPTDALQGGTKLYDRFDPEQLGRAHLPRFDQHAEFSAVSNFRVTPPGRRFKSFRIKGGISAEDLEQLVDLLHRELSQLAEESSVDVVAAKDDVDDRPIALLKALCPTYTIKVSTIQGRHISYRHEQACGDIDILVFQFLADENGSMRWCVLCTVHEPDVAQ